MGKKIESNEKLKTVINALEKKKGVNIVALDVSEESGYTDVMVFVTGTSVQHNKTLSDSVRRSLKTDGFSRPVVEGEQHASWVLIDAGDVVCHIMLEEIRQYYDLELAWSSSSKIQVS